MKVLLIEPPFYLFQDITPGAASFGLAMLAAMAERSGYKVKVFSPDLELSEVENEEDVITTFSDTAQKMARVKDRLDEILASFQPDVVGISFWTARVLFGLELAEHIKRTVPAIKTIAGGVHATILPEDMLQSGVIDYVIRGEGEFSFISLLQGIEKGGIVEESIDNLSFIDKQGAIVNNPIKYCDNLDDLPFPGYEHFIGYKKFDKNVFKSIMFSRGCPFNCNYCASYKIWSRKTRFHSPQYMVAMVKHINEKFGTDYFQFDDDTFTLKSEPVFEICRLIKKEQLRIKWHCDTRVECVSPELLAAMQDAGLETIAMGVESGDPEMRKIIRKTSSLEVTEQAFKIAAKCGINTRAYFMIGFPGETFAQASRTLDFVEKIKPDIPCISICIPYPGTDSYKIAVAMNSIEDTDSIDWSRYYHHSNINFSGKINAADWSSLLLRCDTIDRKARKRMLEKRVSSNLKNITLGKMLRRYKNNPATIPKDFRDLCTAVLGKFRA